MKRLVFLGMLSAVMTVQAQETDTLKNVELQNVEVIGG